MESCFWPIHWERHLYAIETQGATQPDPDKITVANIDEKVAALLGVQVKDIKIVDMAVHPISKEIYLAVTRKGSPAQSVLIKCDHKGNLQRRRAEQCEFLRNVDYGCTCSRHQVAATSGTP